MKSVLGWQPALKVRRSVRAFAFYLTSEVIFRQRANPADIRNNALTFIKLQAG